MTTQEIISHLEHLFKYVRYSEDAPALREAIEMLKCSEIPNSSDERTDKRTGTHACDCISRQQAIDAIDKALSRTFTEPCGEMILKGLPSAQPVLTCDGCRHVGTYDTDFPCNGCVRREKDYYDPER